MTRRVLAITALAAAALAVLVLVLGMLTNPGTFVVATLAGTATLSFAFVAVTRRGSARVLHATATALSLATVAWTLLVESEGARLVLFIAAAAVAIATGRQALGHDRRSLSAAPVDGTPVGPARHGVLILNPGSGGGTAERLDLGGECARRGIEAVVLRHGDDLVDLAQTAVDRGADVIGMAGGDGSQALVADVAARNGVAHVCVPAGTRNHLALDLGLDRADVVGALDAFGDAVERTIDLADVNGRTFVNNVSLGVYAEVVQSADYRDAKLRTTLDQLPELLGPDADLSDLRFETSDGESVRGVHLIQVSNNPYDLRSPTGSGSRARLDSGQLGVVTLRVESALDVPRLVAGRHNRVPGFREWTAPTFRVDSGGPITAAADGEAMTLDPPLEFTIRPAALRVRIPRHAPGRSPASVAELPLVARARNLLGIAAGRMPPV